MQPDLTVSVICTDNRDMLRRCLTSLVETTKFVSVELFVVDNACTDGTADMVAEEFPFALLCQNRSRLGFSSNNNMVLRQATGRHAMLLNDDTLLLPGALDTLVRFMDTHPEATAVGSQLLNPDSSLQVGYFFFPRPVLEAFQPLTDRWRVPRYAQTLRAIEVDWVCGASLVVRRAVLQKVGLLDTRFDPIYSEDTDWCYRIKAQGGHVYYLPDAKIVHFGSQTMNRLPARQRELLYRNRARYFLKHDGLAAKRLFKGCLWISSLVKLCVFSGLRPVLGERAGSAVRVHANMVRCALGL